MTETDSWPFVSQRFLWRKAFWEGFHYFGMALSEWKRNHLYCAILDILARKIRPKRSLCGEIKRTFKARITELYFEAIETNRDLEKILKFWALTWPIFVINSICYPTYFFQNTIPFCFSIQPEPDAVIDCKLFQLFLHHLFFGDVYVRVTNRRNKSWH